MNDITALAQRMKVEGISPERMEWLKKLADMEYCASNPGHWLMTLKETNYLAALALQCLESNLALVEALEKAQRQIQAHERAEFTWLNALELPDDASRIDILPAIHAGKYALRDATKRITELESRTVTVKLPAMNDDLIDILGRPNFMCAHLAELLRKSGEEIKRKSEHEQAAVIHWFLGLYLEHGEKWESVAKSDIQRRAAGIQVIEGE